MLHERRYGRTREPVVNLALFRIRSYVLGVGVGLVHFAGFTGVFFILTQYLQVGVDYPAWKAGLSATPFAIRGALMASLGSRQVLRRGRKLVALGLGIVLAGMAVVWLAVGAHPGYDVALWTALPLLVGGHQPRRLRLGLPPRHRRRRRICRRSPGPGHRRRGRPLSGAGPNRR